jgi:WD40 repeat protein
MRKNYLFLGISESGISTAANCLLNKKAELKYLNEPFKTLQSNKGNEKLYDILENSNGDLISGSYDFSIKIWDANTFSLKSTFKGPSSIESLAFLQNGFLATGLHDNTIQIWDLNIGSIVRFFTPNIGYIHSMSLLRYDSFATVGNTELKIWNTTDWTLIKSLTFSSPDSLWVLKTLPNGELACGSDTNVYIYS